MQFEAHVPDNIGEESVNYAESCTIDSVGADIVHFGETISLSFEGQDVVDIALAILEDDFEGETASQVDLIGRMGGMSVDAMEKLGYSYLAAAQKLRNTKAAHPASQLVSA